MIIVEGIPQSVVNHGVNQLTIIHTVAIAGIVQRIRSHGHILHTARNNNIGLAGSDHSGSHIDTL